MYSSSRQNSSRWSDRKPYAGRDNSAPRSFERKPYAGKPRTSRGNDRSSDRTPDPRQMRYQVIGRTTDESDLIVQISPAFYEYVRSMAHQWVPAPKVQDDRSRSRSASGYEDRGTEERPRYNKFDHPHHKDPLYGKERWQSEQRRWPIGDRSDRPTSKKETWYDDSADMSDIDSEMDDEYEMIKNWFAKLKENNKKPTRTVRSTNKKKK